MAKADGPHQWQKQVVPINGNLSEKLKTQLNELFVLYYIQLQLGITF